MVACYMLNMVMIFFLLVGFRGSKVVIEDLLLRTGTSLTRMKE